MGRSARRLLVSIGLLLATFAPARTAHAATTWQVKIGAESSDFAYEAQAFLPSTVTIDEGDSITWTLNAFIHTVSFLSGGPRPPDAVPSGEGNIPMLNPVHAFPAGGPTYDGTGFVNSGISDTKGSTYSLTFTKAGSFTYVCLLHPGMAGTVVVQAAGSAYPMTQAQVDQAGNDELSSRLAEAARLRGTAKLTSQPGANGKTSYSIVNGIGGNQSTVLRFLPEVVTVKAGDSIKWTVQDPHEIHTVTFYDPAGPVPLFIDPKPQANGPPKLLLPHAAPEGDTEVDSNQELYNSGVLEFGHSYTFSFPKPGVYSYVCVVHAGQGMFGKVTVEAAPAPAPLPNTGVAGHPVLFPATGYSLDGDFLSYWQANGGLPVFGYPIDSAKQSSGRVSQWLERARFEAHPENAAPYQVLLGRLGVEALAQQGRAWQSFAKADAGAAHYFAQTGHAISFGPFWNYWASHGLALDGRRSASFAASLALFGYPISEAQMETNADGQRVLTQWFERARFEYHVDYPAEAGATRGRQAVVLLGRLGAELRAVHKQ